MVRNKPATGSLTVNLPSGRNSGNQYHLKLSSASAGEAIDYYSQVMCYSTGRMPKLPFKRAPGNSSGIGEIQDAGAPFSTDFSHAQNHRVIGKLEAFAKYDIILNAKV